MTRADLIATVGRTPLVELRRLAKDLSGRILAKLEMRNPYGNVKDRVAVALVQDVESRGLLKPGMTIVEATGGNTGIGLAFVCAIRGYRLILTMPETMSVERVALLRQLGVEVVLTPGILMIDAVAQAQKIANELPGAVILDQFRNPANPEIHRRTTAIEIWQDTQGEVDSFVLPWHGRNHQGCGRGSQTKETWCPNHRRGARQRCHPFWRPGGESQDSRNRRRIRPGCLEPFDSL